MRLGILFLVITLKVCEALTMTGAHWSLENPELSMFWLMPQVKAFCQRLSPLRVELHMCAYGSPHCNCTSFLTTAQCLAQIGKLCPGESATHVHEAWSWLDRKANGFQIYPHQLCEAYALAASSLLIARRRIALAAHAQAFRRLLFRQAATSELTAATTDKLLSQDRKSAKRCKEAVPFQRHCVLAVKVTDPKSIGLWPQGFEPPRFQ